MAKVETKLPQDQRRYWLNRLREEMDEVRIRTAAKHKKVVKSKLSPYAKLRQVREGYAKLKRNVKLTDTIEDAFIFDVEEGEQLDEKAYDKEMAGHKKRFAKARDDVMSKPPEAAIAAARKFCGTN